MKTSDKIFQVQKVGVGFPYVFPMGEHLAEGISFKHCVFESSDTSIAIVNEEGTVVPLCDGVVEITATTKDGRKDICTIEITDIDNIQVILDEGKGTHHDKQAIINGQVPVREELGKIRNSSVLRIASTIYGKYWIRKIAPNAFQNAEHLEKVILPESLLYVDNKAFANCTNLKTVFVTEMDTTFEEDTFEGDEIVLKGFEGSKAEEYAKSHDNITFEVIDVENDDYQPYEEAIYFSRNYRIVEDEISMSAGENETLYPVVASVHYDISDISYTSSDSKIAFVKDGIITGKKAGTVTITVSLPNGVERTIKVTVEGKEVLDEAILEPDTVAQQSVQKKNSKVSKMSIKFTTKNQVLR